MLQINPTDDLCGLPTAFHYAGASTVVLTLWVVKDSIGARFSDAFYDALRKQQSDQERSVAKRLGKLTLNLAKALQDAVRGIMKGKNENLLPPYYWAAFVLNGVWRFEVQRDVFNSEI